MRNTLAEAVRGHHLSCSAQRAVRKGKRIRVADESASVGVSESSAWSSGGKTVTRESA
jgi:hypothetical protein